PEHTNAYVPSRQEFESWFADRPEWFQRTADVLKSCQLTIPMNRQLLPVFPLPKETDKAAFIAELCKSGLAERVPGYSRDYQDRLDYELSVIGTMGFIDYFLIVSDFMKYAKDQGIMTGPGRGSSASSLVAYSLKITDVDPLELGIMTGPGRGSSASSLVAYSLKITDVDPLEHGLLFERFLNPERVTLPDIDIDFADH